MEVVYTTGCTDWSIEVDGKDLNDYSISESKEILKKLIDSTTEPGVIWELTSTMLERCGELKFVHHCEQCGDDVYEYKLSI